MVFLQNLIKAFNTDFPTLNITIIAFQYPFTKEIFEWNGNTIVPLNGRSSKLKRIFIWRKARKKMEELLQKKNISAILCCWLTECALIGQKFAHKHKIPLLCWAAGQDARPGNRYLSLLKLQPNEIAVMAPHQIGLLRKSGITCNFIIENGILSEKRKATQQFNIHVLGAGSLTSLKNYIEFVSIIELAKKELPDITCEILGDGPQWKMLQELIQQKKLEKNVLLRGSVSHDIVLQTMDRSLIFLHPSSQEGNSTVILEAAYHGNFILCKKEVAVYDSELIHSYADIPAAAALIVSIIKSNRIKPGPQLLSSMHTSAAKISSHLNLS
jgi:glycosyltransferase involved in cell wall biosynthesis